MKISFDWDSCLAEKRQQKIAARLSPLKNGWLEEVCAHMDVVRKPKGYWTKEKCAELAFRFTNKEEFKKESISAYNIAVRNKWIEEICQHMIKEGKSKGYWTKERCKAASAKYHNIRAFQLNEAGAYKASRINGWLDDFYPRRYVRDKIIKGA